MDSSSLFVTRLFHIANQPTLLVEGLESVPSVALSDPQKMMVTTAIVRYIENNRESLFRNKDNELVKDSLIKLKAACSAADQGKISQLYDDILSPKPALYILPKDTYGKHLIRYAKNPYLLLPSSLRSKDLEDFNEDEKGHLIQMIEHLLGADKEKIFLNKNEPLVQAAMYKYRDLVKKLGVSELLNQLFKEFFTGTRQLPKEIQNLIFLSTYEVTKRSILATSKSNSMNAELQYARLNEKSKVSTDKMLAVVSKLSPLQRLNTRSLTVNLKGSLDQFIEILQLLPNLEILNFPSRLKGYEYHTGGLERITNYTKNVKSLNLSNYRYFNRDSALEKMFPALETLDAVCDITEIRDLISTLPSSLKSLTLGSLPSFYNVQITSKDELFTKIASKVPDLDRLCVSNLPVGPLELMNFSKLTVFSSLNFGANHPVLDRLPTSLEVLEIDCPSINQEYLISIRDAYPNLTKIKVSFKKFDGKPEWKNKELVEEIVAKMGDVAKTTYSPLKVYSRLGTLNQLLIEFKR